MRNRPSASSLAALSLPVLVLAALWLAPGAVAKVVANTINTTATISHKGHHVVVTGPLACDKVQWVNLRVTISQRDTGALAEGHIVFVGTPEQKIWKVEADTKGKNAFVAGPARAVALATTTTFKGKTDDAHQWLVDVTLEEKK